ncbi:MAG: AMP-binding protein [Betaproteobacteria bacterium]|nr:AMP-binding protein [Betaproteobacteria bacterium]
MPAELSPTLLLHDHLHGSALAFPDKIALVCGVQRVTYGELEAGSNALANRWVAQGVQRGDRVFIYADNSVEAVTAFWACLKANAVASVINPLTKTEKLRYLLQDCTPKALVIDSARLPVLVACLAEAACLRCVVVSGKAQQAAVDSFSASSFTVDVWAEALSKRDSIRPPRRTCIDMDLATIIYTSGSTGQPKGVMLTHRNMLTACESICGLLALSQHDVILSVLPLAFNYGLYQMILTFRVGGRLVLERSFAFPVQTLKLIKQECVTGFPGVPTIFAVWADLQSLRDHDLSSIRFFTNTAANLPLKHIQMLQDLCPEAQIFSMYGLTECKRCTCLPPQDILRKPDSVGVAIPNTEMWLVDEYDKRLGANEIGQLVIRGSTVMRGYWRKPDETQRSLRPGPLPGELVFYTGDLCRMDDEGYLYFVGRMDDIIKSRGEKVAPKEVENTFMNLPGVKEVAVIGVPDQILGQAIKAFVVLETNALPDAKQLQLLCAAKLESFMVPKVIEFVASLPRTDTGKITKAGLT